ncbi:putative membrane protein YGL010W [Pedobacter sp. UYP30]|uniref:Mpo1 family 2-hydroxy fatty acid dioxygenase n=1 Tax=Pedobacter sp. UYP30 TaxID=1756400 RepID=UPI003396F50D
MKKQPKIIEPKRPVDVYFDKYEESHNNHTNELIHWVCVPLIVFSLLGLVWNIPFPHLEFIGRYNGFFNWASILIAFTLYYYFTLSPLLAFLMIWVIGIMSYVIVQIELLVGLGSNSAYIIYAVIFVVAWIGQFIGHKIEGKKPSFLDDLRFLLIGPIWLLHFICIKLGLKY